MMLELFRYHDKAEKELAKYINNVFGFYPHNIALYQLAFTHKSLSQKMNGITVSNERLEYLGDAVLSAVVGEYLPHSVVPRPGTSSRSVGVSCFPVRVAD